MLLLEGNVLSLTVSPTLAKVRAGPFNESLRTEYSHEGMRISSASSVVGIPLNMGYGIID